MEQPHLLGGLTMFQPPPFLAQMKKAEEAKGNADQANHSAGSSRLHGKMMVVSVDRLPSRNEQGKRDQHDSRNAEDTTAPLRQSGLGVKLCKPLPQGGMIERVSNAGVDLG